MIFAFSVFEIIDELILMKKIGHIILGMIVGMASVFVVVYVLLGIVVYIDADFIEDCVYNYGLQQGQEDATLEVFKKWSPYLDVMKENEIPIISIDLNADKIVVVKDSEKYVIKKSWSGDL